MVFVFGFSCFVILIFRSWVSICSMGVCNCFVTDVPHRDFWLDAFCLLGRGRLVRRKVLYWLTRPLWPMVNPSAWFFELDFQSVAWLFVIVLWLMFRIVIFWLDAFCLLGRGRLVRRKVLYWLTRPLWGVTIRVCHSRCLIVCRSFSFPTAIWLVICQARVCRSRCLIVWWFDLSIRVVAFSWASVALVSLSFVLAFAIWLERLSLLFRVRVSSTFVWSSFLPFWAFVACVSFSLCWLILSCPTRDEKPCYLLICVSIIFRFRVLSRPFHCNSWALLGRWIFLLSCLEIVLFCI